MDMVSSESTATAVPNESNSATGTGELGYTSVTPAWSLTGGSGTARTIEAGGTDGMSSERALLLTPATKLTTKCEGEKDRDERTDGTCFGRTAKKIKLAESSTSWLDDATVTMAGKRDASSAARAALRGVNSSRSIEIHIREI